MLTNITSKATINRIKVSVERASNTILRSKPIEAQNLMDSIERDALTIDSILLPYLTGLNAIDSDPFLNEKGSKKKRLELREAVLNKLLANSQIEDLDKGLKEIDAAIINNVTQVKEKNRVKDDTLAYLQLAEMRGYLQNLREQKRKEHDEKLRKAKIEGTILSDDQRSFSDPVEHHFLEACKDYSVKTDQLVRAITDAPYPIRLLDDHILAEGDRRLRQSIAPEKVEQYRATVIRRNAYDDLMKTALDILDTPNKAGVTGGNQPRVPQPDQQRAS